MASRLSSLPRGFCSNCGTETDQVRFIFSPLGRVLDWCTLGLLARLGVGPWYCADCEQRSWRLNRRPAAAVPSSEPPPASEPELMPVANVERTQYSLLGQAERTERFSKKFRQDVVQRLLNGQANPSDIRRELSIDEADLIYWIAQEFRAQRESLESQILRLEAILRDDPRLKGDPMVGDDRSKAVQRFSLLDDVPGDEGTS